MPTLSDIYIYREPRCGQLDFDELAAYVAGVTGVSVWLRGPLVEDSIDGLGPAREAIPLAKAAEALATAKVRGLDQPHRGDPAPLAGEVAFEARRLGNRRSTVFGILYDAHHLAGFMESLLTRDECGIERLHVVFTNQLIGTWDENDRRYHARTILMGDPSIISLSGIVEAPARPRGYYLARRSAEALGLAEETKIELAGSFAEDCMRHDDPRMTEVAKGYSLQAVSYRLTGEPFCEQPGCRMFNSHWQAELMESQLGGDKEFCDRHQGIFKQSFNRGEISWTSDYT